MKIALAVVSPVELFTAENAMAARRALAMKSTRVSPTVLKEAYARLFGNADAWFGFDLDCGAVDVVVHDESAAVLVRAPPRAFERSWMFVRQYLFDRSVLHERLVQRGNGAMLADVMAALTAGSGPHGMVIRPSYVFSFSFIDQCIADLAGVRAHLAALSEPSWLRIDDFSRQGGVRDDEPDAKGLPELNDLDTAHDTETYVNWSTVLCVCKGDRDSFEETKALVTAMELRLQQTWNRCYEYSRLVDVVLREKSADADLEDFFLAVGRSIDAARSVISSTASARAQRIFDELVRTSALERELNRLERKSELLEKALDRRRTKRQARDRKLTEALLGGIAGLSLLQVVLPQPEVSWLSSPLAPLLIGAILILTVSVVSAVLLRKD